MFSRAAVTTGSSFSASNVQSGNGHLTFTILQVLQLPSWALV